MMENLHIVITIPHCPQCNGTGEMFGILFESVWCRCKNCDCEYMAGHTVQPLEEVNSAVKI